MIQEYRIPVNIYGRSDFIRLGFAVQYLYKESNASWIIFSLGEQRENADI